MSFDINPPSRNLSNVQASAKASSGGAGNTGYFRYGKGEDDEIDLHFASDEGSDTFVRSEEQEKETILDTILNFFSSIAEYIKKIFKKLFNIKD